MMNEKSVGDAFAELAEACKKWHQDGTPPAPVSFRVRVEISPRITTTYEIVTPESAED